MKQELLKGLTEEQIAKIKGCKNQEEILALAKEEGIELTDERLEAVNGGDCLAKEIICPACGSNQTSVNIESVSKYWCQSCGKTFD